MGLPTGVSPCQHTLFGPYWHSLAHGSRKRLEDSAVLLCPGYLLIWHLEGVTVVVTQ